MARRPSRPVEPEENPPEELAQNGAGDTSQNDSGDTDEEQATPEPADETPVPTQEELDDLDAEAAAQAVAGATESAGKFLNALTGYSDDTPDSFTIAGTYGSVFKLGDLRAIKPMFEAMRDDGEKPEIDEGMKKAAASFIKTLEGYPPGVPDDRPIGGNAAGVILFGDLNALLPLFHGIVHDGEYDNDEDEDDGQEGADA